MVIPSFLVSPFGLASSVIGWVLHDPRCGVPCALRVNMYSPWGTLLRNNINFNEAYVESRYGVIIYGEDEVKECIVLIKKCIELLARVIEG
ncbi:MAG: hypothetical protein B6V02_03695 [Thermoprotei archaeon ex4572_64]|nr:MAG: hypothetical protein B6V02_03695 [Thermoprotei archaeon ex4572_64]